MAINTLIKILRLIPDNWEEIKQQSLIYQQKLNEDKGYLGEKRAALHAGVEHVFEQLHFDYPVLKNKVVATAFYQKFANVFIDFPELFTLPDGFDPDNMEHIQTLVADKIQLLRQQLPDLGLDLDNERLFLSLQQLIKIVLDIPDDIDFSNQQAISELKTNSLGKAKPVINELLQIVLKRDDSEFASQMETGIETITELVDVIVNDPVVTVSEPSLSLEQAQAADPDSNSDANANLDSVEPPALLAIFKQKLPQLAATLSDIELPGIDVNIISDNTADLLTLLEAKRPLVEQLLTASDGEHSEVAAYIAQLKGLLNHGVDVLQHPALAGVFNGALDQLDLTSVIDFNGNQPEQLIDELKSYLAVDEDIDFSDIQQLSALINSKLRQVLKVIAKVSIKGLDSAAVLAEITTFADKLLTLPADASIDSLLDVASALFDKFMGYYQANVPTVDTPNKWLEQVQKLQALYKFIRVEGLDIALIDKITLHQQAPPTAENTRLPISPVGQLTLAQPSLEPASDPYQVFVDKQAALLASAQAAANAESNAALKQVSNADTSITVSAVASPAISSETSSEPSTANNPTVAELPATAANEQVSDNTDSNTMAIDAGSNSVQADVAIANSSDSSSSNGSEGNSALPQMLTTLLTDSGLLAKLSSEQRSYAEHLIAGTLQEKLITELKAELKAEFLEQSLVSAFIERMQQRSLVLKQLFEQGEPTLAALFDLMFDGFKDIVTSFLTTVKALFLGTIDILYQLMMILTALLDYLEIPVGMIKTFFSASLADINLWIDSAKAA
ncbi:MAG: hypothetical protein ACI9LM_003447 [Alteromonadaceae bacterium]|jgi:hypothetical protein